MVPSPPSTAVPWAGAPIDTMVSVSPSASLSLSSTGIETSVSSSVLAGSSSATGASGWLATVMTTEAVSVRSVGSMTV